MIEVPIEQISESHLSKSCNATARAHAIADALSRQPVFQPEETCDILVRSVHVNDDKKDPALDFLTASAKDDHDYQSIVQVLRDSKKLKDLPKDHIALSFKSIWVPHWY